MTFKQDPTDPNYVLLDANRFSLSKPWVGLTDEELFTAAWKAGFDIHEDYDEADEVEHWWDGNGEQSDEVLFKLRDLMEAKLKEKNNG